MSSSSPSCLCSTHKHRLSANYNTTTRPTDSATEQTTSQTTLNLVSNCTRPMWSQQSAERTLTIGHTHVFTDSDRHRRNVRAQQLLHFLLQTRGASSMEGLDPEFDVRFSRCCFSVDLTDSHTLHHCDLHSILYTSPHIHVVSGCRDDLFENNLSKLSCSLTTHCLSKKNRVMTQQLAEARQSQDL